MNDEYCYEVILIIHHSSFIISKRRL